MTPADLEKILEACKSVPMIMLQCGAPKSPQERANDAWEELGRRMGFDHMTVQPTGNGNRFFTAVPSETEVQREDRIQRELLECKRKEIENTKSQIGKLQKQLQHLEGN